jgi:hypothetical protein
MRGDYNISLAGLNPLKLEFVPKTNSVAGNFIQQVTITFQDDRHYIQEIDIRGN